MIVNSLPKAHRRRVESVSSGEASYSRQHGSTTPSPVTPTFSHVSVYRASKLELQVYSPSLRSRRDTEEIGPIAVFGEQDRVGGKVFLDRECQSAGKLTISVEGAFTYPVIPVEEDDIMPEPCQPSSPKKHVFFSSSTLIPVSPGGSSPRTTFRDVVRRRPSAPVLHVNTTGTERFFSFGFDLPAGNRPGEELPSSFSASKGSGSPGAAFDVTYKLKVSWEPETPSPEIPTVLEVPILYQPEKEDFLSADGSQTADSWLEMPLRSDRPIPFRTAVTLPTSVTFPRSSSIPYFAVFTTTPRSPTLAKEIAADAAISVSLLRQVTVTEPTIPPPTPPLTPSSPNEDSDIPRHQRFLKKVTRGGAHLRTSSRATDEGLYIDKPLPQLPARTVFSEFKIMDTNLSIGFPKKPKVTLVDGKGRPSLESQKSLPDGLLRSKIVLQQDMLPNIDWAGLKVKYYLEVAVSLGQDDMRARIPIRIV